MEAQGFTISSMWTCWYRSKEVTGSDRIKEKGNSLFLTEHAWTIHASLNPTSDSVYITLARSPLATVVSLSNSHNLRAASEARQHCRNILLMSTMENLQNNIPGEPLVFGAKEHSYSSKTAPSFQLYFVITMRIKVICAQYAVRRDKQLAVLSNNFLYSLIYISDIVKWIRDWD